MEEHPRGTGRTLGVGRPERRHLEDLAPGADVGEAEAAADEPGPGKEGSHLVRPRGGRDVEVLRRPAEQEVADAAADQVRLEPRLVEPGEDLAHVRVDPAAGDAVLR